MSQKVKFINLLLFLSLFYEFHLLNLLLFIKQKTILAFCFHVSIHLHSSLFLLFIMVCLLNQLFAAFILSSYIAVFTLPSLSQNWIRLYRLHGKWTRGAPDGSLTQAEGWDEKQGQSSWIDMPLSVDIHNICKDILSTIRLIRKLQSDSSIPIWHLKCTCSNPWRSTTKLKCKILQWRIVH